MVHNLVRRAAAAERLFIWETWPRDLIGMNSEMTAKYIEFVASAARLTSLRHPKIFESQNHFDWMELISLQGKTNFFEERVGEYQKAGVRARDEAVKRKAVRML